MFSLAVQRLLLTGAVVAFATALGGGAAHAVPTCNPGNTFTLDVSGGAVSVPISQAELPGACFITQDKTYGTFNVSGLPSNTSLSFSRTVVNGDDHHQLSFNNNYAMGTYNFGYEVQVNGATPGSSIVQLDSDFTQTVGGPSVLTKTTDPAGDPATGINVTKNGAVPTAGSVFAIEYTPGVLDLLITEQLVNLGDVSSITNTVVERTPEPASLLLLGAGMTALALIRRRRA